MISQRMLFRLSTPERAYDTHDQMDTMSGIGLSVVIVVHRT